MTACLTASEMADPDVCLVLRCFAASDTAFSNFANEKFRRGVRLIVDASGFEALGGRDLQAKMASYLALAERPRAPEALKLIKLIQRAKDRGLVQGQIARRPDGAVEVPTSCDFAALHLKIAHKIRNDPGLMDFFSQLHDYGLFNNPAACLVHGG